MSGGDYSRALARAAAAQLAELAGADAAAASALNILADLLQRYVANVAAGAAEYAEVAGRTRANSMDALLALEDLGVTPDDLATYAGLALQARTHAHTRTHGARAGTELRGRSQGVRRAALRPHQRHLP